MAGKQLERGAMVAVSPGHKRQLRRKPDVVAGRIGRVVTRPRCECCGVNLITGEVRYCDTCLWKSTTD
jgi:hypothetical protein